ALETGATFVNDVTALRGDREMASVIAERGADCCLTLMLGEPRTMQEDPRSQDVVSEVKAFLEERLRFATQEGIPEGRIPLDPGIGFGKTVAHHLELMRPVHEVPIEITGLSLFTHVGVTAAEREVGQRLLVDVRMDVGETDATITDRLEDTVDYGEVCHTVNLVAQQRSYKTLERLCAAIAD